VAEAAEQAQAADAGLPSSRAWTTWCPACTSRARAWTRARCTSWPRASRPRASCSRSWCAALAEGANAGKYEIIAGERRFRAARLAGLEEVPVLVREVPDEAAAAMALIENIQREDLNPLEEAQGLQRLVREFGLTHEQAAQAVAARAARPATCCAC
jgi:ParB family chromosome partitioning protein